VGTLVVGRVLYIDPSEVAWTGPLGPLLIALVFVATAACMVWACILFVKAVAEVEEVRSKTAFGHVVLALSCLGVAAMLLVIGAIYVMRVTHGQSLTPI
jgi:glycopeptide antibiotics resistance protein